MRLSILILIFALICVSHAHISPYAKGMFCKGGRDGKNENSRDTGNPAYELPFEKWWFQNWLGCDKRPPPKGEYLELPAGGTFTVEMAAAQAFTTLSYGGKRVGKFPMGKDYVEHRFNKSYECVGTPNLHAISLEGNKSKTGLGGGMQAVSGSAFAISYHSDLKKVTPQNLVVFTVNYSTPWERIATFQVPKDMPPCPPDGCTCAWGWIPDGCGQANIYMSGFKCMVTGSKSKKVVGVGKPPVWCEGEPAKCVKGPKQMLFWHQKTGNNIEVSGFALNGGRKSPAYNTKCGFVNGAQNDIFTDSSAAQHTPKTPKTAPQAVIAAPKSVNPAPRQANPAPRRARAAPKNTRNTH